MLMCIYRLHGRVRRKDILVVRATSAVKFPRAALPRVSESPVFALDQNATNQLWGRAVPHRAEDTRALKILQVMPPGKHFGPLRATSIDLDTRDLVRYSRFRDTTVVVADRVAEMFGDVQVSPVDQTGGVADRSLVGHVADLVESHKFDLVVVQQRLPLASQIARSLPRTPVVFRAHTFQKDFQDRGRLERAFRRRVRKRLYNDLAGILHVSEACARAFRQTWPDVRAPSYVVNNGLDFSEWSPNRERNPEILCVARCAPEKGVLEAAQAVAEVLPQHSGWRASFVLADVERKPGYFERVRNTLSTVSDRVWLRTDVPFDVVKHAYERAAIALVPSKWEEPFGRTALEAHAGGAALISSGTGGLTEISRDNAVLLPEVSGDTIEAALKRLLMNDTHRTQLAQAGAAQSRERFDIRAQAAKFDQALKDIFCERCNPVKE